MASRPEAPRLRTSPRTRWSRAWAMCAGAGARRRTCGPWRSSRDGPAPVAAAPGQFNMLYRLRRRRGADQPQRRSSRAGAAGPHDPRGRARLARPGAAAPRRGAGPARPVRRRLAHGRGRRARRGDHGRRSGAGAAAARDLPAAGRARALWPGPGALRRPQPRRHPVPPRAGDAGGGGSTSRSR